MQLMSVTNFIFYGRSGEISTNRPEDQEIVALSLQLLQNCLVYINTQMIQTVLADDPWRKRMQDEDWRALSPLIHHHVNPYGVFHLDMNSRLNLEGRGSHHVSPAETHLSPS